MTATKTMTTLQDSSASSSHTLEPDQTLRACRALLKHMRSEHLQQKAAEKKPNLLATTDGANEEDELEQELNEQPVWLILGTKRHITDKVRLKPRLISVPHPYHNPNTSILLITAEPKSARTKKQSSDSSIRLDGSKLPSPKAVIQSEEFPEALRRRITTMKMSKLTKNYHSYESKRQLRDSYDLILADERILPLLPKALGKPFYASTAKRPMAVQLCGFREREARKTFTNGRVKDGNGHYSKESRPPLLDVEGMANQIQKTVEKVAVHVSQSTSLEVRIARAGWSAEMVRENLEKVVSEAVERLVDKGWDGVKSIWIKGPETVSLPIWMCEKLWVDGGDVAERKVIEDQNQEGVTDGQGAGKEKKRKRERVEKKNGDGLATTLKRSKKERQIIGISAG